MDWVNIPGYEGLYQANKLGEVRRLYKKSKPKILKQYIDAKGYCRVMLYKNRISKFKLVHRLIAECFVPNLEGKEQVNHKDGFKRNNFVENLEWCTQSENQLHRYRVLKHTNRGIGREPMAVRCVETQAIYNSANEAARENNTHGSSIRACAANKDHCYTSGGYHWEYIN